MFKLIAGGLILFGLVSLMMARYRRIADDDVVARLKSKVPHRRIKPSLVDAARALVEAACARARARLGCAKSYLRNP